MRLWPHFWCRSAPATAPHMLFLRRAFHWCCCIYAGKHNPRSASSLKPLNIIASTYLVREARALIIILLVRRGRCSRADNANCMAKKCERALCASVSECTLAERTSACGLRAPECQQGQLFWCKWTSPVSPPHMLLSFDAWSRKNDRRAEPKLVLRLLNVRLVTN